MLYAEKRRQLKAEKVKAHELDELKKLEDLHKTKAKDNNPLLNRLLERGYKEKELAQIFARQKVRMEAIRSKYGL